jgi:L,D-peptidoglycan transpeptidase YkuD (ErfK/YbiS/YcfS/YnhG family)
VLVAHPWRYVLAPVVLVLAFSSNASSASTSTQQIITVEATHARAQTAVVRTWQLSGTGTWSQVGRAVVAFVGVHGVGPTREGLGRTPNGVFSLTQAFGNEANDGTRLAYFRAGPDDWWDENPSTPQYNHHVHSATSPGGNSENLYYSGFAYSHAVVINYNTNPVVKGAGSGFFLHVSMGVPTEGCVAVATTELTWIMRWLNPALHPEISIGVGAVALAPVSNS